MEIEIKFSHAGPRAVCDQLVNDEQYTAHKDSNGRIRVTATNNYGESRYPIMTMANANVWNEIVKAVKNA